MSCLHPIKLSSGTLVPCGKCPNCHSRNRQSIADRVFLEQSIGHKFGYFLTLTYDNEHLPKTYFSRIQDKKTSFLYGFSKRDCQLFLKSLRYRLGSFRYILSCEYGSINYTHRPHYHAIILLNKRIDIDELRTIVFECWSRGRTSVSRSTIGSIMYTCKYCIKDEETTGEFFKLNPILRPFRLFSSRPGLGCTPECITWANNYIYNDGNIRNTYSLLGHRLGFSRTVRGHLDPSIQVYLSESTHKALEACQENLEKSRLKHSIIDPLGNRCNDFTIDNLLKRKNKQIKDIKHLKPSKYAKKAL